MLEIYFESYGCTANHNSTEIMKGLVKQAGLNITLNKDYADLIVINSCIVKEPTQEKIRRRVQDFLKQDKKVILAGCMPRIYARINPESNMQNSERGSELGLLDDSLKNYLNNNLFLISSNNIKNITKLIRDIQDNNSSSSNYLNTKNEVKSSLPKISQYKFIGINQISEGCNGECSFCIVKYVKGKLFSYPKEQIIKSIKDDVNSGCKEIWITSQDNASYGNEDKEYNLTGLLKDILDIKGDFFLRVGMMNPNNVLKILSELIEIYKHKKMFKFLHVPIQSGSDNILKLMRRNYKIKDVLKIIREFKKQIPNILISTDIIVGFPGETEKDFQETINLIKEIKPEILNISKFWPRSKTKASKFKQIPPDIRISRARELSKLHLKICNELQKPFLNKEFKVLVDKKGFGNTYLARSDNYKLFAVQSREKIIGKKVKVKVKKLMPHYLVSEVI